MRRPSTYTTGCRRRSDSRYSSPLISVALVGAASAISMESPLRSREWSDRRRSPVSSRPVNVYTRCAFQVPEPESVKGEAMDAIDVARCALVLVDYQARPVRAFHDGADVLRVAGHLAPAARELRLTPSGID